MKKLKGKEILGLILTVIILFSCELFERVEPELEVIDIFCTEAVLKVRFDNSDGKNSFNLVRNDTVVRSYKTDKSDTVIIDSGLMPDSNYRYRVDFLKGGKVVSKSDEVAVHTMDTTSHDFVWEVDTLGIYGSYLNDCWIVNENDIYVVGSIRLPDPDSSWNGTGYEDFNAAHWDGEKWEYMRFERGAPLNSIWYFNENDIWASGGVPIHWDGNKWDFYHLWDMGILDQDDGGVDHIWASSPDDIYFAGRKGSIVHYDGKNFTKIESGTEIDLLDIDGTPDGMNIFVVGYNDSGELSGQSVCLKYINGRWKKVFNSSSYLGDAGKGDYGRFHAIKIYGSIAYFTTGGTWLLRYDFKNDFVTYIPQFKFFREGYRFVTFDMNNPCDMILVSAWCHLFHYNGKSWKSIFEVYNRFTPITFIVEKIKYKGDIAVIVGWIDNWAFAPVVRGHRIK